MKLKKIFAILVTCLLMATIFSGCGEENSEKNNSAASGSSAIKIGMLKYLNVGELEFNGFMKKIAETFSLKISPHEVVFFDNFNSMQLALESNQIQEISTYTCVADYLSGKNPNVEVLKDHTLEFIDAFCLATRESDEDLFNEVDKAVKQMRDDGTLEELTKTYIKDLKSGEEPPKVEIEKFEGAETIKVGITGDLPPLDLILADGTPAGFNTAVLSEIGKRINKNIELVQVESSARGAALTSDKVDIIFWAIVPVSEIIPANADKPDGVKLTTPYYRGKIVHVGLKK